MTKREFYATVMNETTNEEVKAMAQELINGLDKINSQRAAKAAEKAAEKAAADAPIKEAIISVLTDELKTASTIVEEAGLEVSPQKVSYMMRSLIADGIAIKDAMKVEGVKGTHTGYRAA